MRSATLITKSSAFAASSLAPEMKPLILPRIYTAATTAVRLGTGCFRHILRFTGREMKHRGERCAAANVKAQELTASPCARSSNTTSFALVGT